MKRKEDEKERELMKKKIEKYIRKLLVEELLKMEEEKAKEEISLE